MRRTLLSLSMLLALTSGPIDEARAEEGGERAAAERLFRAGERAYQAGQYEAAGEAFEKAYEVLPLPAIAFSAAQAYRLQYVIDRDPPRLKRAIELYRSYIEEVKSGGRREDAIAHLADLEPQLYRLEMEQERTGAGPIASRPEARTTTRLMVTALVDGARGSVDGGELAALPLVVDVQPGAYEVRVEADGYFPLEQRYDVVAGEQVRVIEAALRAKPARVTVRTSPGAQVTVDGRPVGVAPLPRPLELEAGAYLLSVTSRGRRPYSRVIEVSRGEELELQAELEVTGQRRLGYGVLGASAASLAGAGVTAFLANRDERRAVRLDEKRVAEGLTFAELDAYETALRRRDRRVTSTYVLLGVGGALAVSGALLWFFDDPRAEGAPPGVPAEPRRGASEREGIQAAPFLSPEGGGLALSGSF